MPLNAYAQQRIDEARQRKTHKAALRTRLERARRKLAPSTKLENNTAANEQPAPITSSFTIEKHPKQRHPRSDPFAKARAEQTQREQAQREAEEAAQKCLEERAAARARRESLRRLHMQRTKKGQPRLAKQIDGLLQKITQQQQQLKK